MGRRSSVATVASGFDSSPSSAETSFRELDDVFLQTQTRIWLGEVLKIRLDEQLNISDLLADGELLFEVSKTLWSLLLEKCVELRRVKIHQFLGSRKSGGRYKPYSNVDSFLKVCKILGLNGIDLFSPSDVVEKRNTRKACICIRAISKKARSKQLNVPDFDLVTYAVVMPTDIVGCIRRSLESSLCSASSCSSSNSYKPTRSGNQQRKLTSLLNENCDSCSEDSDEAESTYFGIESYSSSTERPDYPATLNLDAEKSPSAVSAVKPYTRRQVSKLSDMRKPYRNPKLQPSINDNRVNNLLTCYFKSHGDLHIKDIHTNNDLRDRVEHVSELADVDLALGNDDYEIGDSMFDNMAGTDFISDYLAFSDSVVLANNSSSSLFLDGEDNVCNFFRSIDSHGIDSTQRTFSNGFHQGSLDDMEDVEVSSTASMSSILGRVLSMDFDDQCNGGDSSMVKIHPVRLFEKGTESQDKFSFMEDQNQDLSQCEILSQCSATDIEESHPALQPENEGICTNFISYSESNGQPYFMKSQKLDVCGDSPVPGITSFTDEKDLALAEIDWNSLRRMDLKKAVRGISDLNHDLEQHSSGHIPLNSWHHKICMEPKVSCDKFSLEGNGSHICSLGYENVPVKNVTCSESQEPLNGIIVNHNFKSLVSECESMAEEHPIPFTRTVRNITGGDQQTHKDDSRSTLLSNGSEDFQNENNADISTEKVLDVKNQICGTPPDKPRRKSLINTVVTGTTLIGALFFWLHIRKGKLDTDKPKKPLESQRFDGAKPAPQRGQSSRSNGTYPAEKLKFGN